MDVHPALHTLVLAQLFGLYLFIMAIILACKADYYRAQINKIDPNSFGILLSGSFGLLLGLFLVSLHNFWGGIRVDIVSLFFWFIVIKSILVLSFPLEVVTYAQRMCNSNGYYLMVAIYGVLGMILLACGYTVLK